jgi:hypothetical protein
MNDYMERPRELDPFSIIINSDLGKMLYLLEAFEGRISLAQIEVHYDRAANHGAEPVPKLLCASDAL